MHDSRWTLHLKPFFDQLRALEVSSDGGWRTRTVFERYAIVAQSDIADALQKLESRNFGHNLGHSEETEKKAMNNVLVVSDGLFAS